MLKTKEHYDLMNCFEREFKEMRLDKEEKSYWAQGNIYEDGQTNKLFLAYRRGYALGTALYAELPAPGSVVMPDYKIVPNQGQRLCTPNCGLEKGESIGWNDCIDEFKRLNP